MNTGKDHYDADCAKRPVYHDGTPRKAWQQLAEVERLSWTRHAEDCALSPDEHARETLQHLTTADA